MCMLKPLMRSEETGIHVYIYMYCVNRIVFTKFLVGRQVHLSFYFLKFLLYSDTKFLQVCRYTIIVCLSSTT